MKKNKYREPKIVSISKMKSVESIQLAGVSPRAVIFIKEKLNRR